MQDFKSGSFILEFLREIIFKEEYENWKLMYVGAKDHYFVQFRDHVIDATKKGNETRFGNHSCAPVIL